MERFLAPHEAAILAGDVRVVLCDDVDGELDEQLLAAALTQLQVCYPLLGGRFAARDGRPLVQVGDLPARLMLGHGTSLEQERSAAHTWWEGPLCRVTLLREPTRLVMTLPRAFVDGMSYFAVQSRLWAIYTALRTGRPVPIDVVEPVLGPALDDLLAAQFSPEQLRAFVAERARLDAAAPPAVLPPLASVNGGPGPDLSFGVLRVQVDAGDTVALGECAHRSSLSLNSLVSGALLTSLRSLLQPPAGPAWMLCTSAVDIRRRLVPPIPFEVLQSAATTSSLRLKVDAAATPTEVAREVSHQLRTNIDSGAAAMELAAFPYMIDHHPPTLVITNVGSISAPVLPEGLQISSTCLTPLGHLPMIFAVVTQYRSCLNVDLSYSRAWFTDAQISAFAERASATLAELTRSRTPSAGASS